MAPPDSSPLCVTARGAKMESVANGDNSDAETLRPLDSEPHGLLPRQLTKRMAGIQHHRHLLV